MDENLRSKYSWDQKKYIGDQLSSTETTNINLSEKELNGLIPGEPLFPENGFEGLYRNYFDGGGESYHTLADNGLSYFFFVCNLQDLGILPGCHFNTETEWLSSDVLKIWFRFYLPNGEHYLGIPFIYYLKEANIGSMMHKWELRRLLDYSGFGIYLIYPNRDSTLLHFLSSVPLDFKESKKEPIYDAIVELLGIKEELKNV